MTKPLFLTMLIGLLIAIEIAKGLILFSMGPHHLSPDSAGYWILAEDVSQGDWLLLESQMGIRTPGYPWILGLIQYLAGPYALTTALGIQLLLHFLTLLGCLSIIKILSKSYLAIVICLLLSIFSISRAFYSSLILTESWHIFLSVVITCFMVRYLTTYSWFDLLVATGIIGGSILIRPAAVGFVPILLILGLMNSKSPKMMCWQRFKKPLVVLSLLSVLVGPWCYRNWVLFNQFTPCTFTGCELWTVTFSPWTGADFELPESSATNVLQEKLAQSEHDVDLHWNQQVFAALKATGYNDGEADQLMKQVSLAAIRQQPMIWLFRIGARCLSFWYVKEWYVGLLDYDHNRYKSPFDDQRSLQFEQSRTLTNVMENYAPELSFPVMWTLSGLTFMAILYLLTVHHLRSYTLLILGILIINTLLTALFEIPCYRYRMTMEPFSLILISVAAGSLFQRRDHTQLESAHADHVFSKNSP